MKRTMALILSSCLVAIAAQADVPAPSVDQASAAAEIRQLGKDMGDAMVALDVARIDRMFGDDWVSAGASGRVSTKQTLLDDIRTGKKRLTWFELRPIDVQVFGDTAIAQGNVAEKRLVDGREVTMELVYADILKRRDGRWVVVHSMGSRVR
jgi:ketosteroid isomerase-like protein